MKIVTEKISKKELEQMAKNMFGNLVKAVVDIKKEIMAIDAPMHADQEAELIKNGSKQEDLWGINLYSENINDEFKEFDSMINHRPNQGNRSRSVEDPKIRRKIIQVVNKLVEK